MSIAEPATPSLEGLPTELKDQVLDFLTSRDALNLSKTSKALRATAIPALYRNISLDDSRNGILITLLARTMLENPAYFDHVRKFKMIGTPAADMRAKIEQLWHNSAPAQAEVEHGEDVRSSTEDFIFAMVFLSKFARLEEIHVGIEVLRFHREYLKNSTGTDKTRARIILSRFDKLKGLTVSPPPSVLQGFEFYPNGTNVYPLDVLLEFLILPALRHLEFPLVSPPNEHGRILDDAQISSKLRTLRLTYTFAPPSDLKTLLRFTPFLEELVYDLHLPSKEGTFWLNHLRDAITQVQPTLRCFTIRFGVCTDQAIDPQSMTNITQKSLGSLNSFPVLTDLNISLAVLYGRISLNEATPLADMLPYSLRHLTINDDLWDFDDFHHWIGDHQSGQPVMDLLRPYLVTDWRTTTPNLEDFTLDAREQSWVADTYWETEGAREFQNIRGLKCTLDTGAS